MVSKPDWQLKISRLCTMCANSGIRLRGFLRQKFTKPVRVALSVSASALVLIGSVAAFVRMDRSLAWFMESDEVQATGMTVAVDSIASVTASLKSHGVLNIKDGVYTVEMSKEKYDLPQHDPNGILYSQYTLALFVEITLQAAEDVVVGVSVHPDDINAPQFSTAAENVISNVVMITQADYIAATQTATKQAGAMPLTFTSVNAAGNIADIAAYLPKSSGGELATLSLTAGVPQTMYCIMEYNQPVLEIFNEWILMNRMEQPEVSYANDLHFEVYAKIS